MKSVSISTLISPYTTCVGEIWLFCDLRIESPYLVTITSHTTQKVYITFFLKPLRREIFKAILVASCYFEPSNSRCRVPCLHTTSSYCCPF